MFHYMEKKNNLPLNIGIYISLLKLVHIMFMVNNINKYTLFNEFVNNYIN